MAKTEPMVAVVGAAAGALLLGVLVTAVWNGAGERFAAATASAADPAGPSPAPAPAGKHCWALCFNDIMACRAGCFQTSATPLERITCKKQCRSILFSCRDLFPNTATCLG